MEKKQDRPVLVTDDGRELPIRSISMLDLQSAKDGIEAEYRSRGEKVDPPTYQVTLTGGVKVPHVLTEKNLETDDPVETARRKSEWAEHIQALDRMSSEFGRVSRDIFLDGLDIELPSDDLWVERRKRRHIEVPEDPYDKLNYYKMTEILRTPANLIKLQQEVVLLSSSGGVDRATVEAAGASFLRELFAKERQQNLATGATSKTGGEEDQAGELGTQSNDERDSRKPRVGSKTKRTRRVLPK